MKKLNIDRFIKFRKVAKITGLSHSELLTFIFNGDFPGPMQSSPHNFVWLESEIKCWKKRKNITGNFDLNDTNKEMLFYFQIYQIKKSDYFKFGSYQQ